MEEDWIIPEKFLDTPLDAAARKLLVEEIGFPRKWTSFKKWIETSSHYSLLKKKIKGDEFFLISQK